ncbi:hypothetical protein MRX96_044293 [Rhipicephalus microplus]
MTTRYSPFALLQILLLAALGQSLLVTSAQLFVPFERDWRTGLCPVFNGPSFGDGLSAVFVAAPSLSAAIRFPAWQQGTASAVPATSWGAHKHAHFDATSGHDAAMTQRHSPFALLQGHDAAMTQRHSPFALLQILLLAALGQSPLVNSAQLFVPFERDWRTGLCPVFDGPSFGDGLSAVFVAAPSLSAAIRFPARQQGTASAVPATSWGAHKRAHFDATSGHDAAMTQRHSPFALLQGHDAAMTQRHSPFALLQILLLAALGQSPLVTSAQLFVPFERDWRTGLCPVFDGPSFGDGLSAVFVAAPSLSAAIRFPARQQGTASAVPATSWGAHKRAHFDATSGHDAAMTQRHSPFALLQSPWPTLAFRSERLGDVDTCVMFP